MDDDKVKLYIMGISFSPLQSGAFALLLAEENGPYRIPIVIGSTEARSIAIQLEHIVTPRPITHDLFTSFAHAFNVDLQEVFIYKFEDGIFSSEMTFNDGFREVKLDARTSDALAIALRMGAPIYTTRQILLEAGTILKTEETVTPPDTKDIADYYNMSIEALEQTMQRMIDDEEYEEAAKISEIIKNRKK